MAWEATSPKSIHGTKRKLHLYMRREEYEAIRQAAERQHTSLTELVLACVRQGLPSVQDAYHARLREQQQLVASLQAETRALREEVVRLRREAQPEVHIATRVPRGSDLRMFAVPEYLARHAAQWGAEKAEALMALANRTRDHRMRSEYIGQVGVTLSEVEALSAIADALLSPTPRRGAPAPVAAAQGRHR